VKLPGVLLRGVAVFARWKMTKYKPQSQATSDACGRGRPQGVRPGEIRRWIGPLRPRRHGWWA